MKSDSKAFRERASDCRDLAGDTADKTAQGELRSLAADFDDEARDIDAADAAQINHGLAPNSR